MALEANCARQVGQAATRPLAIGERADTALGLYQRTCTSSQVTSCPMPFDTRPSFDASGLPFRSDMSQAFTTPLPR